MSLKTKTGGGRQVTKLKRQNVKVEEKVESERSKTQAQMSSACHKVDKHVERMLDLHQHHGDNREKSLAKINGLEDEVAAKRMAT